MRLLQVVLLLPILAAGWASDRQLIVLSEGHAWMIQAVPSQGTARIAAYADADRRLGVHYQAACRLAGGRVLVISAQDSALEGPRRQAWSPDSFVIDLQTGRCFKWDEAGRSADARVQLAAAGIEPDIFAALAEGRPPPAQRLEPPAVGVDDF